MCLVNPLVTKPPAILIRTVDGVNRLVSPVNGRTITATMPLVETDTVSDIAYIHETDRLFILLSNGSIWTYRTDRNPCTIVDIWEFPETSIHVFYSRN
jgi:hypothetical protein